MKFMILKNISDITWSVLRYMVEKYNQVLEYAKECERNENLIEDGETIRKLQKIDEDYAVEERNVADQEIQAYIPAYVDIGVNTDRDLESCCEDLPEKRHRDDTEENHENKCNLSIPEKIEIHYEIKSCKNRKSSYYRLKNEKFIQMLKEQRRKMKNNDGHPELNKFPLSGTPVMSYIEKKHEFINSLIIPSNNSSLFKVSKSENLFSTPNSLNDLDSNPANTPASQNNGYPDLNDAPSFSYSNIMDSPSPKLPEFKSSPSFSEGSFVSKHLFCPGKSSEPEQSNKNAEKPKEIKFSSPKFEINPFHSRNSSDQSTVSSNPLLSSFITSGRKFSDILYADEEMTNLPSQAFISASASRSVFGKSNSSNFPPFLNKNK
ncbi:unnamed protein product [Blepharisma stoltei]|uniref:Uncharacterized protein n=1 Tax=Blepharisma stoltei TaxID=1481888 RepID=A0AAU9IUD5_9CILI|nr:unnamed protein product [Blepharisma stoltei]